MEARRGSEGELEREATSETRRGHHRILLGAAAGVGKTYRMLLEGQQAADSGIDVVIGYLEPHDRKDTIALAEGLEQVPRRRVQHAGVWLEEMDVDAVLRRVPELALIDELAHTNAPGGRNVKRYEDVAEVLAAGIDVISTVNIQHLESLNDVIFEVTGVRVRETFPDQVLDDADEVVLVDLTPEELRDRIRAGKVYPKDRVDTALSNFFSAERLSSLRQLALREVAEDVQSRQRAAAAIGEASSTAGPRPHPGAGRAAAGRTAADAQSVALGPAAGRGRRRRAVGAPPGCAPDR